MFRKCIMETPLTTEGANDFFTNIAGESYNGDATFLSTLRALVGPRIGDGNITVRFLSETLSAGTIRGVEPGRVVRSVFDPGNAGNITDTVFVCGMKSDHDSNLVVLEVLKGNLEKVYPEYHCLDKVREFYRKSFAVECFIAPDRKNVVVFVDGLDLKKLHYLQVSILAFLPWYFDPKKGLTDLEMKLIYSLRETNPDKYLACLGEIASQYDFKSARTKKLLEGFELRMEKRLYEAKKEESLRITREINEINSQISGLIAQKNETDLFIFGLMQKMAEAGEKSEIMDYFLCNSKLSLEKVNGTKIHFAVKDYITYFDSDLAERVIDNAGSFVYYGSDGSASKNEGMKKLLKEIFVSEPPRLKIRTCAAYVLDVNGGVSPSGNHGFDYEFSSCMPNPHINRYNCMGNYLRVINELLEKHDYIMAIEQCVASCKSLNWGDSAVMTDFMDSMWGRNGTNNRCIELPDGSVVDPEEAIKWLEEQENAKTEETENE